MSLAAATSLAWGDTAPTLTATACLNPGGNARDVLLAASLTEGLFQDIGVKLTWRLPPGSAKSPCILITLQERTLPGERPGALAYAFPYDAGGRVVVFYDRVRTTAWPELTPALLAHVMAHEIAHILAGVDSHSEEGLMKSRWGYGHYKGMARGELRFSAQDQAAIHLGLQTRLTHAAAPEAKDSLEGAGL